MRKLGITILFLVFVFPTFGAITIINSFNAGELSPLLEGRTDISKYYSGCRTLENCIVLSYGCAQRRPGTKYIASAKESDVPCRLIPFEFSVIQAYILEFGDEYIRFYKDGGQITSGGAVYEISSPYRTDDLFDLHFVQSADTMYLVHPDYQPRTLTREDHDDWTLAAISFSRGPFLDQNTSGTTITPSGTTGSITLTGSVGLWSATHVGAHWQITHTVATENTSGSFTAAGQVSSSLTVQFGRTFDFSTHGTWTGTVILQRSYDSGSIWKDVRPVHYENDGNITFTDAEGVANAIYRVRMDSQSGGTCNFNLTARSFDVAGVVEITSLTSSSIATATVEETLGGTTAVTTWSEGAWSDEEGWPSTVAFYEERLVFANTTNSPQTIWFSQTADWTNMLAGVDDADAMSYTIAADQVNAIKWLIPQNSLLAGTSGGEWQISSTNLNEPITPTNVAVRRQSTYGSADIQAVMINNVILYVQRQARKVRELVYSFAEDSWVAPDLTLLAEHITESGITQIAYQKTPDPTLWCVRADGQLAGMTYLRDQEVVAWHRHLTAGDLVESVAVIPGTDEDEVWVSVNRTISGSNVRYVEQFQPREWDDSEDAFFVDSGLTFDGGAPTVISDVSLADPAVMTIVQHPYSDGDQIRVVGGGMTEIVNNVYTVSNPTNSTFELRDSTDTVDIDSSGFTAYSGEGTASQVENRFSTLTHLNKRTVNVQGDGGFVGTEVVAASIVELDEFYNTVHIGLPYTSRVKPMRLEVPSAGTMQGQTKRINRITLRFHETLGCKVGDSWTNFDPVIFRDAADPLEFPTPLFSGDKRAPFVGDYETDGNIFIQQDLPLPFTLIAVIPEFEAER